MEVSFGDQGLASRGTFGSRLSRFSGTTEAVDTRDDEPVFIAVEKLVHCATDAKKRSRFRQATAILERAFDVAAAKASAGLLAGRVACAAVVLHFCALLSKFGRHNEALEEALAALAEVEAVMAAVATMGQKRDAAVRNRELLMPGQGFDMLLKPQPKWVQRAAVILIQAKHCVATELEFKLSAESKADDEHSHLQAESMWELIPQLHQEGVALAAQLLPPKAGAMSQRLENQAGLRRKERLSGSAGRRRPERRGAGRGQGDLNPKRPGTAPRSQLTEARCQDCLDLPSATPLRSPEDLKAIEGQSAQARPLSANALQNWSKRNSIREQPPALHNQEPLSPQLPVPPPPTPLTTGIRLPEGRRPSSAGGQSQRPGSTQTTGSENETTPSCGELWDPEDGHAKKGRPEVASIKFMPISMRDLMSDGSGSGRQARPRVTLFGITPKSNKKIDIFADWLKTVDNVPHTRKGIVHKKLGSEQGMRGLQDDLRRESKMYFLDNKNIDWMSRPSPPIQKKDLKSELDVTKGKAARDMQKVVKTLKYSHDTLEETGCSSARCE